MGFNYAQEFADKTIRTIFTSATGYHVHGNSAHSWIVAKLEGK